MADWEKLKERYETAAEFKQKVEGLLSEMDGATPKKMNSILSKLQKLGSSFDLSEIERVNPKQDPNFSRALRLSALLEFAKSKDAEYLALRFLYNELSEQIGTLDRRDANEVFKQANELSEFIEKSSGEKSEKTPAQSQPGDKG